MPRRQWSNQDIVDRIDLEGFEYTFLGYYNPKQFEDPETRRLAQVFVDAAQGLAKHLGVEL